MKRKHPSELLLRLLLEGETIDHNGYTYGMSEKGELLARMFKETGPGKDLCPVFYRLTCDISAFFKMAEEIGFDELALKCCAISLRGAARGNKERVESSS